MMRSKQLATVLLAMSIPAGFLLSGCHTTVVQPVEVRHVPDDHHDDHHDDDRHPPPDRH